jgi:hypothetical protein
MCIHCLWLCKLQLHTKSMSYIKLKEYFYIYLRYKYYGNLSNILDYLLYLEHAPLPMGRYFKRERNRKLLVLLYEMYSKSAIN